MAAGGGPFFDLKTVGRGSCFADYDNDGNVDAFLVNFGGPGFLLHNISPSTNHWTLIKLVGTKSNTDGIGAVVEVTADGLKQTAQRVAGSSYLSQDDGRLHFGLGSAKLIDKISVQWPAGKRQELTKVPVDQVVTVTEK